MLLQYHPFALHKGLLRYKNRLWIGNNDALKQQLAMASIIVQLVDIPGSQLHIEDSNKCLLGKA